MGAAPDPAVALMMAHARLVGFVLKTLRGVPPGLDEEDLRQEGMIALWHGARRFDPRRGVTPATYLVCVIRRHLLDVFDRRRWRADELPAGLIDGRPEGELRRVEDRMDGEALGYGPLLSAPDEPARLPGCAAEAMSQTELFG